MKRAGWDPTHRNRSIGTAKFGRGQDNAFVIPNPGDDGRAFWERLNGATACERQANSHRITFLVEPCRTGFVHAVTIDDVGALLRLVPQRDLASLGVFAFRQPKKKECILSSVWGRFSFIASLDDRVCPAIILEAQNVHNVLKWTKSLNPYDARELERLRSEGHEIEVTSRNYVIRSTLSAIRNTQLFRTIPHEIGHYVHYNSDVVEPAGRDEVKRQKLAVQYQSISRQDKENYANRYASAFNDREREAGTIPFDRLFNAAALIQEGLKPSWFRNKESV